MKRIALIAVLLALPAWAGDDTSKLVKTSKDAKAKRKASTSKVITNKDVKNSKGKIVILPDRPMPEAPKNATGKSPLQVQDEQYRLRVATRDRIDAATKDVAELEKKLALLEQRYYEENDPGYRDAVIQQKFAETKQQLDDARGRLTEATEMLERLQKP